jgi:hypothetical protein
MQLANAFAATYLAKTSCFMQVNANCIFGKYARLQRPQALLLGRFYHCC